MKAQEFGSPVKPESFFYFQADQRSTSTDCHGCWVQCAGVCSVLRANRSAAGRIALSLGRL